MEAKVRFTGAAEEAAGASVDAVEGEAGGSVGELQAKLADVKEADVSFERGDIWGILREERRGAVKSGVLPREGEEGPGTGLDGTAGVKGRAPFTDGGQSLGLAVVCEG